MLDSFSKNNLNAIVKLALEKNRASRLILSFISFNHHIKTLPLFRHDLFPPKDDNLGL